MFQMREISEARRPYGRQRGQAAELFGADWLLICEGRTFILFSTRYI